VPGIDKGHNLIRIFPVPFFSGAPLAILIGKEDNLPEFKIHTALQTFYAMILSTLSATLASIADETRQKALGRMTHELEVPVVAIRGAVQSIQENNEACNLFDEDYPGDIWSWTNLMECLIENADVYRYVRGGGFKLSFSKVLLFKDVLASAKRQIKLLLDNRNFKGDRITSRGFDHIPKLWLDKNRFQQVMFNLLANSIKFANPNPDMFRVEIEAVEKGKNFIIYFRDWGPGISEDDKERVFDEEYRGQNAIQSNVTGQGLGLWIVRQIIEKHGGSIRVSNFYQPTEFEIELPEWRAHLKSDA
jgi:signal transduction histidine kinase